MPTLQTRPAQRYFGKRVTMAMRDFATRVPTLTAEVLAWLDQKGVQPTGRPFLRYHVVDMPEVMDVEVGVPVGRLPEGEAGIDPGVLPEGRYATEPFTGVKNGVTANQQLIAWIAAQGEAMDAAMSDAGEVFVCRYETILTDAKNEPDQDQWQTEVAIKVREA